MVINEKLGDRVEVSTMPGPVEFWITPPVPAPLLPVTVRPAVLPVLLRTIPLTAPFDAIERKFRPPDPIVVLETFSADAVVVARVLAAPVTFTVPPPVAASAALVPVDSAMSPLN